MKLVPLSRLFPWATLGHPNVVAIPPVKQQIDVCAEAGRITRGKHDVPGAVSCIDCSIRCWRSIGNDVYVKSKCIEVVLDLSCHGLNLLVIGGTKNNITWSDTRLRNKLLSLINIMCINSGCLVIVSKRRRKIAGSNLSLTRERIREHLVCIKCIEACLANLNVVPRSLAKVKHCKTNTKALNSINGAACTLKLVYSVCRNHFHSKSGSVLLCGQTSSWILKNIIMELLVLSRSCTVVVSVWNKVKSVVRDGLKLPWTRTNWLLLHLILGATCWNNTNDGQTLLEKGEVGNSSFNGNSLVILLLYGSNWSKHWDVNAALCRRTVEGLNNVICLYLVAIRKLCAVTDGNLKGVIVNLLWISSSKLIERRVVVEVKTIKALNYLPVNAKSKC